MTHILGTIRDSYYRVSLYSILGTMIEYYFTNFMILNSIIVAEYYFIQDEELYRSMSIM